MIDWPNIVVAITTVAGAFGIKELIQGWLAKRTGLAQAEKNKQLLLLQESDQKDDKIDDLLEDIRIQREYSSLLRRLLFENGVHYSLIPDWPKTKGD